MKAGSALVATALLVTPLVVGSLSALTSGPKTFKSYYDDLPAPPLRPPPQVFGPVWTVLYLLMGAAAATYYMQTKAIPPALFWVQLALNFAWSPVFFGLKRPDLALAILAALLVSAVVATYQMYARSKTSGLLMLPYLAWLLFATYLNTYIVVAMLKSNAK
jgi:translocator protein